MREFEELFRIAQEALTADRERLQKMSAEARKREVEEKNQDQVEEEERQKWRNEVRSVVESLEEQQRGHYVEVVCAESK